MSIKTTMAVIEYEREKGFLYIYFEMMDCKHYIEDEHGGQVELPENIAKDFTEILMTKYKHLNPSNKFFEKLEIEEKAKKDNDKAKAS